MDGIYDLFSDDAVVSKERADALQQMLRGNQMASGLAALSGAKSMQPFAQMTGHQAQQQGNMLGEAGAARLRLTMQGREHAEARKARAHEQLQNQAFRHDENELNRAAMMQKQEGDTSPVDPVLAAEIQKTGVNPAAFKNRGEAMKYLLQPRAGQLDLGNRKFGWEQGQRDELTPAQSGEIADLDTGLKMVDGIARQKANFDTGPVAGRWNALANVVGMDDPQKSAFRARVMNQLANYILTMSGKASSEQEAARLRKITPDMNDNDATFSAKLEEFRQYLDEKKASKLDAWHKSGRNTSNFEGGGGSVGAPLTNPSQPQGDNLGVVPLPAPAGPKPAEKQDPYGTRPPAGGGDRHAALRSKYGI